MCSVSVLIQVVLSVFITWENVESMSVDLHITANSQISWCNEFLILVSILVLASLKELAFNDTWVLLGRLENWDCVIRQEECYDESSVDILWGSSVKSGCVSQDFLVVVNVFEEVSLGLFREEFVDIAQRIDFVTETVVGWNLKGLRISGFRILNISNFEMLSVLGLIEVLCELVNALDSELSPESINNTTSFYFIASHVVVSNKVLSWLINSESLR